MPIISTGAFANENTRHLSGLNPLEAIIFTLLNPALFNCSRIYQMAAAETPVPIKYFSSCSVLYPRIALGIFLSKTAYDSCVSKPCTNLPPWVSILTPNCPDSTSSGNSVATSMASSISFP